MQSRQGVDTLLFIFNAGGGFFFEGGRFWHMYPCSNFIKKIKSKETKTKQKQKQTETKIKQDKIKRNKKKKIMRFTLKSMGLLKFTHWINMA